MPNELSGMRPQVYKDPRPADYFVRFHERSRRRGPDWVYDLARLVCSIYSFVLFRARCISSDNVPRGGPVILAPNHFSNLDHFFVGMFLRRKVRFMAKSQLFKWPMQFIYTHGGAFPVRRGQHDEEAFVTAEAILAQGGCLVMYAEGGRSRTGSLGERPRPGIGRLALESGAPVVPLAIYGSQRARNWKRLQFPNVTIQFGAPLRFEPVAEPTREQQHEAADLIFGEVRKVYAGLAHYGRRGMIQRVREQRRAEQGMGRAATA
jgi:1-acyl-sn-glycerol-3-phosphate acyltransferase